MAPLILLPAVSAQGWRSTPSMPAFLSRGHICTKKWFMLQMFIAFNEWFASGTSCLISNVADDGSPPSHTLDLLGPLPAFATVPTLDILFDPFPPPLPPPPLGQGSCQIKLGCRRPGSLRVASRCPTAPPLPPPPTRRPWTPSFARPPPRLIGCPGWTAQRSGFLFFPTKPVG